VFDKNEKGRPKGCKKSNHNTGGEFHKKKGFKGKVGGIEPKQTLEMKKKGDPSKGQEAAKGGGTMAK